MSKPQSWDWLEDRRGEDNKMYGRMWEAVEIKTRKIWMEKTEERREERESKKEIGEGRKEKERKKDGSK